MTDMTEVAYPDWDDLTVEEQDEEIRMSSELTPSRYAEARIIGALRAFRDNLETLRLEEGI